MKKPLIIASILIFVVALAAFGWRSFIATPQRQSQLIVAHPTQPPKHLAPEGVYFLLKRVYVPTNSGGIGLSPGTQVNLVSSSGSIRTVTEGYHKFEIDSSQLTNDLDIAGRLAKADAATQNKLAQSIAKSIQEHEKQEQDKIVALDQEEKERQRRHTPPPRGANPLDRGAYIKR
jgi:hypothetical protein